MYYYTLQLDLTYSYIRQVTYPALFPSLHANVSLSNIPPVPRQAKKQVQVNCLQKNSKTVTSRPSGLTLSQARASEQP